MQNMKLLILDIDGVMTNGCKTYDHAHHPISKNYNDKDFTAIKIFKKIGVAVCFLSSDENINRGMAKERDIDFYYSRMPDGSINKKKFLPALMAHYHATLEQSYYVGDDFFDLDIMLLLPKPNRICPQDAPDYVKTQCGVITGYGGQGVVANILSLYLKCANRENVIYDLLSVNLEPPVAAA